MSRKRNLAVKLVAILEIMWSLLNIILISIIILLVSLNHPGMSHLPAETEEITRKIGKPVFILSQIFYILELFVSIGLYIGAEKKREKICWPWAAFFAVKLVFYLIITFLAFPQLQNKQVSEKILACLFIFGPVTIHIYVFFIVFRRLMQIDDRTGVHGRPTSSAHHLDAGDYWPGAQPGFKHGLLCTTRQESDE